MEPTKKVLTSTDVFCSMWASMLRVAMLKDPKNRGCRLNSIDYGKRKDKVGKTSLMRRYETRYRSL